MSSAFHQILTQRHTRKREQDENMILIRLIHCICKIISSMKPSGWIPDDPENNRSCVKDAPCVLATLVDVPSVHCQYGFSIIEVILKPNFKQICRWLKFYFKAKKKLKWKVNICLCTQVFFPMRQCSKSLTGHITRRNFTWYHTPTYCKRSWGLLILSHLIEKMRSYVRREITPNTQRDTELRQRNIQDVLECLS